jgi:hypothetical protein
MLLESHVECNMIISALRACVNTAIILSQERSYRSMMTCLVLWHLMLVKPTIL